MDNISENNKLNSQKYLPFIIGISGHRDIVGLVNDPENRIDVIKQVIKDILLYWKLQVGESTPIWLLSGMAEGADLIAVEAASELVDEGWDTHFLRVIPCLPMESSAYEKDFSASPVKDQFGLLRFRQYLDKYKDNQIVIKNALSTQRYQDAMVDMNYGKDRNSLYLNQGAFLARYSNVLLCLWDGHESEGVGGTGDVVKLKLGQEINWPKGTDNDALKLPKDFDGQIGGIVHHIPVRRLSTSERPVLTDSCLSFSGVGGESSFECYISYKFDRKKTSQLQDYLSEEFTNFIEQLRFYNQNAIIEVKDEEALLQTQPGLEESSSIFNSADNNAIQYQSRYRRKMICFFLVSLFGLVSYELIANFLGMSLGIIFNVIILISVFICWRFIMHANEHQWKWKYQLCRGVAESLRIRGFLNLANIPPDNLPLIPRRQRKHLPLFSHAITVAEFDWWKSEKSADYQAVNEEWLVSQHNFLSSRLQVCRPFPPIYDIIFKRPLIANNLLTHWAKKLFIAAVSLGCVLLIVQLFNNKWTYILPMGQISFVMMLFVQYCLMTAGAMALWSELAGYKTTASGYENLLLLYARAICIMDKKDSIAIHYTLRELAREAIIENCEWNHGQSQCDLKARK